jgi:hypothetical protein
MTTEQTMFINELTDLQTKQSALYTACLRSGMGGSSQANEAQYLSGVYQRTITALKTAWEQIESLNQAQNPDKE